MNQQIMYNQEYNEAIKVIKEVILQSRYTAARLVNKEMLSLYYFVGEYISKHSRIGAWGNNALDIISRQLQQELPGLRGFSVTSLKKCVHSSKAGVVSFQIVRQQRTKINSP